MQLIEKSIGFRFLCYLIATSQIYEEFCNNMKNMEELIK